MNVLAVGSSLIDFFVELEDNDNVKIEGNNVILPLGAKLPIDIKSLSMGGNATNSAAALSNLSVKVSLYTYLSDDPLSKHIQEKMEEKNIELIIEKLSTKSGSLSLIFDFPTGRIIFSHHNKADYSFDESRVTTKPDYIFLTSIGKVWEHAYEKVLEYAEKEDIPLAFSPGSQQIKDINDTFIKTIGQAKMLLCNIDEAKKIGEALGINVTNNTKDFLLNLKKNNFDILSITDGANGAYCVSKENEVLKINAPKSEGHEKTGAGDAYAGAFLAATLHGKTLDVAMKWGVLNAQGEMRQVGAQTGQLTYEQMEKGISEKTDLIVEKL